MSGRIELCSQQECGYTCCDFAANNYIVLYPGEREEAIAAGHTLNHLAIETLPHGGHRAFCRARDRSTCDGGYKPTDCASYPLFPTIDPDGGVTAGLKGAKCPLTVGDIVDHRRWVIRHWSQLVARNKGLVDWIRTTRLVGYVRVAAERIRAADDRHAPEHQSPTLRPSGTR